MPSPPLRCAAALSELQHFSFFFSLLQLIHKYLGRTFYFFNFCFFFSHPKQSTGGGIPTPPLVPIWSLSARTEAGERTNLIMFYNQANDTDVSSNPLTSAVFNKAR